MTEKTAIPEELLSGYLDGTLVQQDEQKARQLLEESAEARLLFEDLKTMREAARGTAFKRPEDLQYSEAPRTRLTAWMRFSGFSLLALPLAGLIVYGLWQLGVADEEPLSVRLMVFAILLGLLLMFSSVLFDRLRDAREDPYRKVKK